MSIMVEVWGDYAAFNRPEMKTERVSYDCITPSAARGILDAIYWHPSMHWIIDCIYVCNPIKTTNIRRNEVKEKISGNKIRTAKNRNQKNVYMCTTDMIQQRGAVVLKDVRYVIKAHFEMTSEANESDNPGKIQDIMKRRLERGQCYHRPYFGVREFPVNFRRWDEKRKVRTAYQGEKDLGYMLYDMNFTGEDGIEPMFFRAVLKDGVLDLRDCEVLT